jgi:hypothetical protein
MKLSEALKKLIDAPDDLSTLPQLVSQVAELEKSEEGYLTRIAKLQEINKSYLAQIPIPGQEPVKKEEEPKAPTLDDAKNYLIEALGGKEE